MKILHLTHTFLPVTENWIYNQLVFNTRCKSSVLCQYRENESAFPLDGVFSRYSGKSFYSKLLGKASLKIGGYSKKHAQGVIDKVKPDLIHGHFAYVSCCHLEALKKFALPFVTTCYGLDISKLPQHALWRKRYAGLFSRGAAFIVEGPHMAESLAKLGCPAEKIHCIPIGVNLEAVRGRGMVQDTYPQTNVLFTGLSREKKGTVYAASAFIEVAKKHPELRFNLIGTGKYLGPVRIMIEKAGLADNCTFHGQVSVSRYLEILRSSDIVLAPSVTAADGDNEGGAPVTVIEAQVAGIPVVGTTHCDIPFVVKNGETGLLCPEKDAAWLAANLEKLVLDRELRTKMGKAAAISASEQHDIKKQVEKINEVYTSCVENNR